MAKLGSRLKARKCGNTVHNFKKHENRFIDRLDRNKKRKPTVDIMPRINTNGDRVWSF